MYLRIGSGALATPSNGIHLDAIGDPLAWVETALTREWALDDREALMDLRAVLARVPPQDRLEAVAEFLTAKEAVARHSQSAGERDDRR